MHVRFRAPTGSATLSCALFAFLAAPAAITAPVAAYFECPPLADTCSTKDVAGTAVLPGDCTFGSRIEEPMVMLDGLPPGAVLSSQVMLHSVSGLSVVGAPSTGTEESFQCKLLMEMSGSGPLSNFHRTITVPLQCVTNSGPRTPGDSVQTFDTDMFYVFGQMRGDPDFDLLRITGGTSFGLPSPGHTTLTRLPSGHWQIDSFFDITYRIDFVGKPGGPLGGMSGSTTATIRMNNAQHTAADVCSPPIVPTPIGPVPPCPAPCSMKGDDDQEMVMLNGLPPGSPIRCRASLDSTNLLSVGPGGTLGGTTHGGTTVLALQMQGEGSLSSFTKSLAFVCSISTSMGQVSGTAPTQRVFLSIDDLNGELPPGDRDFDLLRVTAGGAFGMPSPGHTTLTRLPGGNWAVDSFFDITYQIEFAGHSPGPLAGMSGSTTGTIRMKQGVTFPSLQQAFDGMLHVAMGGATFEVDTPPFAPTERRLPVRNLGSSGEDGVEIQLMSAPSTGSGGGGGGTVGIAEHPAEGLRIEWDWAGDGAPSNTFVRVPQGAGMRLSSFFDIFYGDLDIDRGMHLNMQGVDGFQTQLGVSVFGFDPVPIQAACSLRLDGATVATQDMLVSPQMIMMGLESSPADGVIVQHRLCCDTDDDGDSLPDIYEITITCPTDTVCSFPGLPTITADQAVLRISLNGLPPGTRYIGNARMQMKSLGLPMLTLHDEKLVLGSTRVSPRDPRSGQASGRRIAVGDVNGDGAADVVVTGVADDDLANESIILFHADADNDGVFDDLSSVQSTQRFGMGSLATLPPNGRLRASFIDVSLDGQLFMEARRCDSGTCVATEMRADFSSVGATTLRCRAYQDGLLVADISGVPMGHFATINAAMAGPLTIKGDLVVSGALRCDWSWGKSNRGTIHHGGGGLAGGDTPVVCDRLVIEPEDPVGTFHMRAMDLAGSGICELLVTDAQASSRPACPADIYPATGGDLHINTDDLLLMLGSWGPCVNGCSDCRADIFRTCSVDTDDLLLMLGTWGTCPGVSSLARDATPAPGGSARPPRDRR